MLNEYKVVYHPQVSPSFHVPTNPFRGSVYSVGPYYAGKTDIRDHFDITQGKGVDLSEYIVSLSWSDNVNAPYSNAQIELKIPDDLHNYLLPGSKPFMTSRQIKPQDIFFNQRSNPLANFFFKQMRTGAWMTIHYPLPKGVDEEGFVYPACFFGKLANINYSIVTDELGHTTYTNIVLQCESFVHTLIESQFRVRLGGEDVDQIKREALRQKRQGGAFNPNSPQTGRYGSDQWIGTLPPNNMMSVSDWVNYILNPLISLAGTNRSLGYLFEKFAKLFASQMVPASVFYPQPQKDELQGGLGSVRTLADTFIVNYSGRHAIGTRWENYEYSLGQASNFKAIGSAVGKSSIWRWLLDTFVVDTATIECFPLLVPPKGHTKRERDEEVSRLLKALVANSAKSNYAQASYPQSRIDQLSRGRGPGYVPTELTDFNGFVNQVKQFPSSFTPDNPLPDFGDAISSIDGMLNRRGNPVEFNEYDNDILKAIIIRDIYLSMGVIPTVFYRLKPLAPGMWISKSFMKSASVENSPFQTQVGSQNAFGTPPPEESYFETASEKITINEFEGGLPITESTAGTFGSGPSRIPENYALLDSAFWAGASFNYSEGRRINGVFFDNVFTTGNDTLFDLSALELVPDPVLDPEDIKKDGFRVYEGSFPFMQIPDRDDTGTILPEDKKKMLLLPQAMAERAFVLLGKDNEYSTGVITMVYHENWDIMPGLWGALPLGDYEIPTDIEPESVEAYQARKAAAQRREEEINAQRRRRREEARRNGEEIPVEDEAVTVVGTKRRRVYRLPSDKFFEFYIEGVDREVTVDQETGQVVGMIHITYSRGSIGRKQNLFRYYDFGLDRAMTTPLETEQE